MPDEANPGGEPKAPPEPTVTMTQAKLDAIIASRIAETKAKYSDYDALKTRAAELEAATLNETERLQKAAADATAAAEKVAADLAAERLANTRMRVAMELNLPSALVDRLKGDTEDALRSDAASLLELVKQPAAEPKPPTPDDMGAGRQGSGDSGMTTDEVRRLAREDPAKFNALFDEGKIPASALRPGR